MAYLEIPIAAFAAFMLGFAWYTALFGKAWQAETGVTDEQAQSSIAVTHGLAFLMMCIIAYGINYVINLHAIAEQTFVHGGFHGLLAAAIYCIPAVACDTLRLPEEILKIISNRCRLRFIVLWTYGRCYGSIEVGVTSLSESLSDSKT